MTVYTRWRTAPVCNFAFLHKLQGDHMWSQTWSYLRSFEILLYPTPSWAVRFTLKLIRETHFTGFPALKEAACFADMVWFFWNCDRSWIFPRIPGTEPASCASCCGVGDALLGEGTWCQGSRACKLPWGWGSWHHRICGLGAGCQATRAPFFFWKKTRFLNTKIRY